MFRLDGKAALITGAAGGIGAGIALALARQGADIAVCDRPGQSLEETVKAAERHGHRVFAFEMDILDTGGLAARLEQPLAALGHIDILVNNAGINRPGPALEVTEENWDAVFATNLRAGFFIAQKLAPAMIERGWGRVIWTASQAGVVGIPNQSIYCSSKGAVVQLIRTLGLEWAKHGVTVNCIAPTFVETNQTRARLQTEEFRKFVLDRIPAGKLATTEDVGAAAAFLSSEQAGMVTCHTLLVDGGWTAW
jgi:NAD(P)-dependent dehydrogenase (short-subunit alcohol dehydrogenase family)